MDLGLATLLAQLFEWPEKQPNCCVSGLNLLQLQKKKLSYPLSHTLPPPPPPPLVCTHSNCVSSHLITLSSSLPSLLVSLTRACACTCTRTHPKRQTSPQPCWILFDKLCASFCFHNLVVCVFFGTFVDEPSFFSAFQHYDLIELNTRGSVYLPLLCVLMSYILAKRKKLHNGTSKPHFKGRSFLFSLLAQWLPFRRMVYCKGSFIMYNVKSSPVLNICRVGGVYSIAQAGGLCYTILHQ